MEIFLNDRFQPVSQAAVSVHDRGLLYGDGLFETIKAVAGRPLWLREHLTRLTEAAAALRLNLPPTFPWAERLAELLRRNALDQREAVIKILVTRGQMAELGLPPSERPTIILYARPYTPPSEMEYQQGWAVVSFPEPRTNFLSRYKSLNYLFCLVARQYALDRGAQEALILEPDGLVTEGAATAILWQENGQLFRVAAGSFLPSVTLAVLGEALAAEGVVIRSAPVTISRLQQAEAMWLANSLMGLMPVASLNGRALPSSPWTTRLQERLWSKP